MTNRAKLRGKPLDADCKTAKTTTHEYGPADERVFCLGLFDAKSDEPIEKCYDCKAFVENATPLSAATNSIKDEIRILCPMRHDNGNCLVAGGFCTAVDTPICDALHNAYETGKFHAMEEMKKQGYRKQSEGAVRHGTWYHGIEDGAVYAKCSACGRKINYSCYGYAYCALCGARMDGLKIKGEGE